MLRPIYFGIRRRVAAPATQLGAALIALWSAGDLADGAVTDWADSVGALTPTQGTADSRPVKAADSFEGGYPGVTADGTADHLRVDSIGSLPSGSTTRRIMVVAAPTLPDATARHAVSYGGTSSGTLCRVIKGTGGQVQAGDGTTNAGSTSVTGWTSPGIAEGVYEATTYTARINGGEVSTASGATLNTSTNRTTLLAGNANTAANFFAGVVHAILIGTWSDDQRLQLEGYYAARLRLSSLRQRLRVSHPYRNAVAV